jgi:hypothetical protein
MARPSKMAGRRPIKHAGDRFSAGAIGAIGAIGGVTKTPPKFALQTPANSGVLDPAYAVLKDTCLSHGD